MAHFKIYQEPAPEKPMAEKHINDFTAMEQAGLGTVIGHEVHSYPGLTPIAKKCKELASEIAGLEEAKYELSQIRATLILNFGYQSPHNRYNFSVDETQTTSSMLLSVLTNCCRSVNTGTAKE